jgi:NAD(P)-dependent dehydrogenase (short-subunit alcohol dehydrogenase family)
LRVLIVGGSSSVGQAVATAFARRGDSVLGTYAHSQPDMPEGVGAARLDLEASESFPAFAQDVRASLGGIDHLVLLAAILPGKGLADYPDALIGQVMTSP